MANKSELPTMQATVLDGGIVLHGRRFFHQNLKDYVGQVVDVLSNGAESVMVLSGRRFVCIAPLQRIGG